MERGMQTVLILLHLLIGTVVGGSDKKGVCMSPGNFLCDDFHAFGHKIKWWYDWAASGVKLKNKNSCENIDEYLGMHVPMGWGNGTQFPNYYIQSTAKYFLGFNEPNHKAQSDLTAKQAAELWPHVKSLAEQHNLILVSPAAAPCGHNCNGDVFEWFDEFFVECGKLEGGCGISHLATHVYYCNPDTVMNYLHDLWTNYSMPIWVTEFACAYETDPAKQLEFMEAMLDRLESTSYIFRYAWYMSRLKTDTNFVKTSVSLLEKETPTLTALGTYYANYMEDATTTTTASSATSASTTTTASSVSSATSATSSTSATTATSVTTQQATGATSSNTVSDDDSTTQNKNSGLSLLYKSNVCIVFMILVHLSLTFV